MRCTVIRVFLLAGVTLLLGAGAMAAPDDSLELLQPDAARAAAGDQVLRPVEIIGGQQVVFGASGGQVYAFAGTRLLLYDVSFPNHPVLLCQFSPFPGEAVRAAWLYQDRFAFVLTSAHFTVIDVLRFGQPRTLSSMANVGWNRVYVQNNLLVLAGYYQMNIYQVNSPDNIVSLSGTSFSTYPARDVFAGSRYYRALATGLEIVDFSDPLAIKSYTSSYTLDWSVYGLAVRPPYVFLHGYIEAHGYSVQTLDISNLSSPQVVYTGDSQYGDNMTAVGNYGYACSGYDLQLFDLSDPAHPYYLGQPNHACSPGGFRSGSRYYSGSAVFDISDPAFPKLLGLMDAGSKFELAVSGRPGAEDQNRVYTFGQGFLSVYDTAGASWSYRGGLGLNNLRYFEAYAAFPHLYLLDYNGLEVIDISSPPMPSVAAHYDDLFYEPDSLAFYDAGAQDYLYVAHDGSHLAAINVTNPLDPAATMQTANLTLPDIERDLAVASGRLFVATGASGVQVYSLANPASPVYQSTYAVANAGSLAVKGTRLFVATGSEVRVIDTASLAQKSVINVVSDRVVVSGNLLYVDSTYRLNVFDISNPDAPRWVSFTTDGNLYGRIFSTAVSAYWLQNEGLVNYLDPQPVESKVFSSSGGQFAAADGSYQADFPACAVAADNVLFESYRSAYGNSAPAADLQPVRSAQDFVFIRGNGSNLNSAYCPFTLQVHYQNTGGLDEPSLMVYYLQGTGWVKAAGSVDTANDVITAQIPAGVITWGVFGAMPGGLRSLYLPVAQASHPYTSLNVPPGIDFSVQRIEPVQVTNPASGLSPLIAGKSTVVRIYVASGTAVPVYGVRLVLYGERNNTPLPGSPLVLSSWAVMPVSYRENLATTFNVSLPVSWTQAGTITLTAFVDDANQFSETDENNNSGAASLTFNGINPLDIVFVPIDYTHTPTGAFFPHAENTDLSYDLRQIFPVPGVSIAYHTPVSWAGDLSQGTEWTRLLAFIDALKKSDNAPYSTLYYGVIPTRNPAGDSYSRAWGGYGYIGSRASIGVQGNPSTFAHESGHNLSLNHAPCGGAGGPDPSFPYSDARIGQFGVSGATLAGYNPLISKDFMSYCYPEWVSDYFYQKLYTNQKNVGGTYAADVTAAQDVLVVRALAGGPGLALLPVYQVQRAPVVAEGPSDYRADLLDAQGNILASTDLAATPLAAEDLDGQGYALELYGLLPALDGAARVVVRQAGDSQAQGLAGRALAASAADSAASAALLQTMDGIQTLSWSGVDGLLRVSIRPSEADPWQLYAIDWPAALPLALPPGQWLVHWRLADHTGAGYLFVP